MAVNTRILGVSLAAAVVISVVGGYALSRSGNSGAPVSSADDNITLTSNGDLSQPIGVNREVEGKQLPTVTLHTTDGSKIPTDAVLNGRPTVINVWATTCEACKTEMPALAAVHAEFGDRVQFVGVNQFVNNDIALAFAKNHGVTYELLDDRDGDFVATMGITGLPYTLFVAPNGTIVLQKGIALDEATIRASVNTLLAASQ